MLVGRLGDGVMTTNTKAARAALDAHQRPMVIGGALMAAGGVLGLAGLAVGGTALVAAVRHWARELDEPPTEMARRRWEQAKAAGTAATAAGQSAWRDGDAHQRPKARK
jgi:hypothetical protein